MIIELGKYQAFSLIGEKENQEDAYWATEINNSSSRFYILCDGMGGHENGEIASNTVIESLSKWILEHHTEDSPFTEDEFYKALSYVYRQLEAKDNGVENKMGTTLAFVYFHKGGCFIAHIGDSRIYQIRPSEGIIYKSKDHSLVQQLIDLGEISPEEAKTHPQRNIITKVISPGNPENYKAEITHLTNLAPCDYFLLCSDGAVENVSDEKLIEIFSDKNSTDEEKKELWINACGDNNHDNYSAIIIPVERMVKEKDEALDNIVPLEIMTMLDNGKYKIVKLIGSENGGITYLGVTKDKENIVGIREFYDNSLYSRGDSNRLVSLLPEINPKTLSKSKTQFILEAESLPTKDKTERLNIIDTFGENGTQYYVFEFKGGGSLQEYYDLKGKFSPQYIVEAERIENPTASKAQLVKVLLIILVMLAVIVGTWEYALYCNNQAIAEKAKKEQVKQSSSTPPAIQQSTQSK